MTDYERARQEASRYIDTSIFDKYTLLQLCVWKSLRWPLEGADEINRFVALEIKRRITPLNEEEIR